MCVDLRKHYHLITSGIFNVHILWKGQYKSPNLPAALGKSLRIDHLAFPNVKRAKNSLNNFFVQMIGSTISPVNMHSLNENIYHKCRVCVQDIADASLAITIFSRDFLDEKIRKYLHVNIDFSDKYQKRLCRNCLIKLEDIHQFACLAQRNQQIFIKYAENLKKGAKTSKGKSMVSSPPHSTTINFGTTTTTPTQILVNEDVTIFACNDLKLGQMIRDEGLQKLILKALKWDNIAKSIKDQLVILKNTSCQEILSNPALLQDEDLMQLLGPYLNPEMFPAKSSNSSDSENGTEDNTITEMEVGVDPELFFPYDDDETRSAEESITHIKEKPLICSSCPQMFSTQSALQDHIMDHLIQKQKKKSQPQQRPKDEKPKTEKVIESPPTKRTRKKPTTTKFMCNLCGKKLSTKGNLKVHFETHKPKGKFSCEKCGRIFKTYINLIRHKKYHSGEKFACPTCSRVYPTNSTLRAHIISHSNVRPHECPICFKTFKRNQDLKFHINQHTGDKPYKCPYCSKAFASSGNCFSHRKRMHSDKN